VRLAVLLVAALLQGCNYQQAGTYRDVRDQVQAVIIVPLLGWGPCARAMRDENFQPNKSLAEICYKLTPPRRRHGLWRNNFEGSQFCEAPATRCPDASAGELSWLRYSFGVTDTRPRKLKVPYGGLYEVDFIGRRTAVKGRYGHLGGADHYLIVDRMIWMREVEPPPKQEE